MHPMAVWLVLLMTIWIGIQSLGCSQQPASQPEAKQEHSTETAVGGMTRTAIEKAKAVEGTLQQSADRTAGTLNAPTQ